MRFGMMVARGGLYRHIDDMRAGDRLTVLKGGDDDFYTVTVEAREPDRQGGEAHPSHGGEVEEGVQQEGTAEVARDMTKDERTFCEAVTNRMHDRAAAAVKGRKHERQ